MIAMFDWWILKGASLHHDLISHSFHRPSNSRSHQVNTIKNFTLHRSHDSSSKTHSSLIRGIRSPLNSSPCIILHRFNASSPKTFEPAQWYLQGRRCENGKRQVTTMGSHHGDNRVPELNRSSQIWVSLSWVCFWVKLTTVDGLWQILIWHWVFHQKNDLQNERPEKRERRKPNQFIVSFQSCPISICSLECRVLHVGHLPCTSSTKTPRRNGIIGWRRKRQRHERASKPQPTTNQKVQMNLGESTRCPSTTPF